MKSFTLILSLATILFSCSQKAEKEEFSSDNQTFNEKDTPMPEATPDATEKAYFPKINAYIATCVKDYNSIDEERKMQLKKLALYIKSKVDAGEEAKIIYICTHNSRRSHMSQLWGMVAADYYGIDGVSTYSGGTEATAFNERSVACLKRAGFQIVQKSEGENPVYEVVFSDHKPVVEAFSKKYSHKTNPHENFAAVMTCSHADKNCPTVAGASLRVAVPYEDPKVADNTPEESATYDERCKQIATEEFYLFSQVKG